MKRWILLILASLFIFACSQSDDGPMSVYPDSFAVGGYGYMLYAQLDSGNRFHIQGDSITLAMDSMWTFGNCFLKEIELYPSYSDDTVLTITVKLALGNTGTTDCPQPLFRPDTVLHLPFLEEWKEKNVREIRIEGNAHNEFYPENPDTAAAAYRTLKDSILIRQGKFRSESISVYLDTAFSDPYTYPRRTSSDTAADSLVYCLSANWENDSTSLSDSTFDYLDTTWFSSKYFLEKIPKCASVDHGSFTGSAAYGRYFTTQFILFVPVSGEKSCGPAAHSNWFIYNLSSQKEVLDSARADTLLSAWKKASVGESEEEDDE